MASETVNSILAAEADGSGRIAEARSSAEEIVAQAEQSASIGIQNSIAKARTDAVVLRDELKQKAAKYAESVRNNTDSKIAELRSIAQERTDAAADGIIERFFRV